MYTVIGFPGTRAFRILWMLEELDISYRLDPVMPGSAAARAATGGMLPAPRHGETLLFDSVAILQFLAARHGRFAAEPGSHERARQDAWTIRIVEQVDVPLSVMLHHRRLLPADQRTTDLAAAAEETLDLNLHQIAEAMGDRMFLGGDDLAVPDFLLGHCLRWSGRFFGRRLRQPRLVDYLARIERRQGYVMTESA